MALPLPWGVGRLRGFTESGALFSSGSTTDENLNRIPGAVVPVQNAQTMGCNIHRGNAKASYEIGAMGRVPALASYGFFDPAFAPWLQSGKFVFIRSTGECFRIMGIPHVLTKYARLAHVKCLLDLCLAAPQGIPHIFYDTGYAYPAFITSGTDTYIPA